MASYTPWQQTGQYPGGDSFNPTQLAGPTPFFRDQMDFLRSGWRATPEAQYPDGYLGTIPSRRGDRLLDGLKQNQQRGPKIRGIHKGDQMDASDYMWKPGMNPEAGLMNQAMTAMETFDGIAVQRYVSPGLINDPLSPAMASPRRAAIQAMMQPGNRGLTPPWSTPPAPVQPGMVGPVQ